LSYEGGGPRTEDTHGPAPNRHRGEPSCRKPDGVSKCAPEYVFAGLRTDGSPRDLAREEYSHARPGPPGTGEGPTIQRGTT